MRYEFHPAAEAEYLESIAFFESKQRGLGASFLNEFESKMDIVCTNPKLFRIECAPDIRRTNLNRFPYTVIYRIQQNAIQILAVAHQRRRPLYWMGRL